MTSLLSRISDKKIKNIGTEDVFNGKKVKIGVRLDLFTFQKNLLLQHIEHNSGRAQPKKMGRVFA